MVLTIGFMESKIELHDIQIEPKDMKILFMLLENTVVGNKNLVETRCDIGDTNLRTLFQRF